MGVSIGFFIWNRANCEEGDAARIAAKAVACHLGHVLIKTNDGRAAFNGGLNDLVQALHAAKIHVWAWQYSYGLYPYDEADTFAARAGELAVDGLCVDAEAEYKWRVRPNPVTRALEPVDPNEVTQKRARAVAYMDRLRAKAPKGLPLAVTSYYLPDKHANFPWSEFLSRTDFAMPQVYWNQTDPTAALSASLRQYAPYIDRSKLLPVGAAYQPATGDVHNITTFLQQCALLGFGRASFWSWEHATPEYWAEIEKATKEEAA